MEAEVTEQVAVMAVFESAAVVVEEERVVQ